MTSTTGLHIFHDTGSPGNRSDYTTLVVLHGLTVHSPIFAHLSPLAESVNARIVLVNQRDYPGAVPYSPEERALLSYPKPGDPQDPRTVRMRREAMALLVKHRAHELLAFLAEFVRQHDTPVAQPAKNAGGIVVVGWSLGTFWMSALLAHVASSPESVYLSKYVRRVILYDGASFLFGFPRPIRDPYMPLIEPIPLEDIENLTSWLSGFYAHGDTVDTLERRTPLRNPPPTLDTLTPEELGKTMHAAPGELDGAERMLLINGHRVGLFAEVWRQALDISPLAQASVKHHGKNDLSAEEWREVEVRVVWCDQSLWEAVYAAWSVEAELEEARRKGRPVRNVNLVRMRGANHFIHWHEPRRVLSAFLGDANSFSEARSAHSIRPRL